MQIVNPKRIEMEFMRDIWDIKKPHSNRLIGVRNGAKTKA
jgi:hypothetical protein